MLDLGTLQAHIKLDGAEEFNSDLEKSAKGTDTLGSKLKSGLVTAAKAAAAALAAAGAAAATAFAAMAKGAVDTYADMEQLEGGVTKLFGDDAAATVMQNAQNAFSTIGLSANDYMSTVTSFSASLISSLGGDTAAAATAADTALQDMADNASVFGSDMESIQSAYQGFAKGQYQLLDNLKLGYGGSQQEMERLLADAEQLTGVHYDISNLNDVYSAIHVIQEEQGIAGNAAAEASKTISGSIASTKAAYENFLGALADPDKDMGAAIEGLFDSAGNVVENLIPVLENIANAIPEVVPMITAKISELLPQILPALQGLISSILQSATTLLSSLLGSQGVPPEVVEFVGTIFNDIWNAIIELTPLLISGAGEAIAGIIESLPTLIPAMIKGAIQLFLAILTGLSSAAPQILSALGSVLGQLVSSVKTKMQEVYNGVSSAFNNVVNYIRGIPGKITSALGNLGSLLSNAGRNLMQGLLDGITAGWQWIQDKVSGMGSWIADHKGPKAYDLKLLVPNGGWIMEGLMQGIDNALPALRKQLQGVTDTIQGTDLTVSSSIGGTAAATVGGSNYNIYINGTQINNDTAIENKFMELMTLMARKGMM